MEITIAIGTTNPQIMQVNHIIAFAPTKLASVFPIVSMPSLMIGIEQQQAKLKAMMDRMKVTFAELCVSSDLPVFNSFTNETKFFLLYLPAHFLL
jgi:hypothetical protein